jgi:NAD(P)-dependent dehydrogenase (short-subunit alcohol dehydrogenase family)
VTALSGRVAVITGGGRGIGAAIALQFASEGASLLLGARSRDELLKVQRECISRGAEAEIEVADVSIQADVVRLIDSAQRRFGAVDVLVNAAGTYGPIGPFIDVDLTLWERTLQVNLMGTLYACRAVLPGMSKRRRGSIINFSGGGATAPLPRFSAYAVSKAALVRLTDSLAAEVAESGVRVNAIAPGAVDTRLQDEVLAAGDLAGDLHQRIESLRTTGAGATSIEIPAKLAVFLASDASIGLTGKLISAPHDPWQDWDEERIAALSASNWLTLRRIDPFTIRPLLPITDRLP